MSSNSKSLQFVISQLIFWLGTNPFFTWVCFLFRKRRVLDEHWNPMVLQSKISCCNKFLRKVGLVWSQFHRQWRGFERFRLWLLQHEGNTDHFLLNCWFPRGNPNSSKTCVCQSPAYYDSFSFSYFLIVIELAHNVFSLKCHASWYMQPSTCLLKSFLVLSRKLHKKYFILVPDI